MYRRFNYMPPVYYRNTPQANPIPNPPPVSQSPVPKPPPCKPTPKKKTPPKKKFNFKSFKKDTCSSLNDVEHFLNDFSLFFKYIKLYKLLK